MVCKTNPPPKRLASVFVETNDTGHVHGLRSVVSVACSVGGGFEYAFTRSLENT